MFTYEDTIDTIAQTDRKAVASRKLTFKTTNGACNRIAEVRITQALRTELANRFLIQQLGKADHAARGMTDKLNAFIAEHCEKLRSEGMPKLDLKLSYSNFAPHQV